MQEDLGIFVLQIRSRQEVRADHLQAVASGLMLEKMLVEEIGVCWWKLHLALGWEVQEIRNRRKASKSVIRRLVHQSDEMQFPCSKWKMDVLPLPA